MSPYKPDQSAAAIVLAEAHTLDKRVQEKAEVVEQTLRGESHTDVISAQADLSIAQAALLSKLMAMVAPLFAFANNGGMPSKRVGRIVSVGPFRFPAEQLGMVLFRIVLMGSILLLYFKPAGGSVKLSTDGLSVETAGNRVAVDLTGDGSPDAYVIEGHLFVLSATNNPGGVR